MPTGFEKLTAHGFGERQEIKREPVDDLLAAVTQHPRLVVLGDPGSGKTTTLWRLTYDLAVRAQADADAPLPLFVPLGGYTGDEAPIDYAAESFGDLAPYLSDYLQEQRVVLLLDALNEMPQADYKARVGHIQALLDKHPAVSAVVTCRELDYVEALNLAKLEIKPLDVDHQRAYVHRYLGEQDGERLFWQLAGGDQILELWNGWQAAGGTWEQFWTADDIPERCLQPFVGSARTTSGRSCAPAAFQNFWSWAGIPLCSSCYRKSMRQDKASCPKIAALSLLPLPIRC